MTVYRRILGDLVLRSVGWLDDPQQWFATVRCVESTLTRVVEVEVEV